MKIALIVLSALFVCSGTYAQSRTVSGLLLDRDIFPTADIHIYIHDSVGVGRTDAKGKFEIALPNGVDSIIFGGLGFEPLLVRLTPSCSRVEAIMVLAGSYDFMSPAKVDRQRSRYFKKMNKLYPIAVQKGLFAAAPPCFKAIFQLGAPRKKEMHKQWLRKQDSAQHKLHAIQAEE